MLALVPASSCAAQPFAVEDNSASLPAFLSAQRLNVQAPLGSPRFEPESEDEVLTAIFASWNLLDALMAVHEPASPYQTGYLRELQVRRMVQLVRQPGVNTYCEVGMNGGHSLIAMLLANRRLKAHAFDLFKWKYSWPVATLLNTSFGGRLSFHPGHSHNTLTEWTASARAAGTRCDLVLVDGGHTFRAARADVELLQSVATPQSRLVIDDIAMPPGYALKVLNRTGTLVLLERYGPYARRSRHSPCMRAPPGMNATRRLGGRMCPMWGFAVSRFGRPGTVIEPATAG